MTDGAKSPLVTTLVETDVLLGAPHDVSLPLAPGLASTVRLRASAARGGASQDSARARPIAGPLLQGRFAIVRQLGEGGMGTVFAVHDGERGAMVALKTLHHADADRVYGLKKEFRSIADVKHPNLVALHELFEDDERWFFTMELVEGVPFDRWVRPGDPATLRPARLRDAVCQLARAISALHERNLLHCDLKPSNVLVSQEGCLKVLDFGISVSRDQLQHSAAGIRGTPAYIAPEQLRGSPPSAASDAYAIGVMLFEALTGHLPFEGAPYQVLFCKQWLNAPAPASFVADLPPDLAMLCSDLLARYPERRPSIAEIVARLDIRLPPRNDAVALSVSAQLAEPRLIGRDPELSAVRAAFAASSTQRRPTVMLISGESGIGKSALVKQFLQDEQIERRALLLAGRCFERERVPFKAFDLIVDQLSSFLSGLDGDQLREVLPGDVVSLRTLFPVLGRIPLVGAATPDRAAAPAELRERAFLAFGELLANIRARIELVVHLDDLQWGDLDSSSLLLHVLRHQGQVPFFLIVTHRREGAHALPWLEALYRGLEKVDVALHERSLAPLPAPAARALLATWISSPLPQLLEEGAGNPLLLRELARSSAVQTSSADAPSLQSMLRSRVDALPAAARRLLHTLVVAACPMPLAWAADAATVEAPSRTLFELLRAAHLVKAVGDDIRVECFHDRVREVLYESLSRTERADLHRALARVLTAMGGDSEQLAVHLLGAGDVAEAVEQLLRAAQRAQGELGFDRATRLYSQAIELLQSLPPDGFATTRELSASRALANAHEDAGNPIAASQAHLRAAALSHDPIDRVRAAEVLWGTGAIEDGKRLVAHLFQEIGLSLPSSSHRALLSGLWWRARARLPALRRTDATPSERLRFEMCFAVGGALGLADAMGAFALQGRAVYEAKRLGRPEDIARALGSELIYVGATGRSERRRAAIRAELQRATRESGLAESAFVSLCTGYEAFLRGELSAALPLLRQARGYFQAANSLSWLSKTATRGLCWVLFLQGRYEEFREVVPPLIHSTRASGDRLTCLQLGTLTVYERLLAADATGALQRLSELQRESSRNPSAAETFLLDRAGWHLALYQGDLRGADWLGMQLRRRWRPVMRFAHVRVEYTWYVALLRLQDSQRAQAAAEARSGARHLLAERLRWPRALGWALLAATDARDGRAERAAARYEAAAQELASLGFFAHAEAANLQRAFVLNDAAETHRIARALQTRGVADVSRWLSITMPGPYRGVGLDDRARRTTTSLGEKSEARSY